MKGTRKYYVLYKCASHAGFVGYTVVTGNK